MPGKPPRLPPARFTRRLLLASLTLPALQACTLLLPPITTSAPDAHALLDASATAHGLAGLAEVTDISVRCAGEWHALVGSLVSDLVDPGHRGGSEERLLLREHLTAQAHAGPAGRKQVVRRADPATQGTVQVWFDGAETQDTDKRDAAALVADGYTLSLLGPMLLAGHRGPTQLGGPERITVDGHEHPCDILRIGLPPGLGLSAADQIALYIDRDERLMRRIRFSLDGLDATRDAIAEADTVTRAGVRWPTRFHERLPRPLPLAVHDWRMTGLDLDRGLAAADIGGPAFTGRAPAPANA